MTIDTAAAAPTIAPERADLIAALGQARFFLRHTTRELTTEQAAQRTTVSALTLGGLIKHVTAVERTWAEFLLVGATAMTKNGKEFIDWGEDEFAERERDFVLQPGETLDGVLADYDAAAARTDEVIGTVESLDTVHRLAEAPWNTEKEWTVRRAVLQIIAETTQHAGHADIIREALDGAKSMG